MALVGTPTLDEFKAWLGLEESDTTDDVVLTDSLEAALATQAQSVRYPSVGDTDTTFTPDLTTAVWLRAQRLAARRNSPEGIVGLSSGSGDFAGARLPAADVDASRLEAPYTVIGVA